MKKYKEIITYSINPQSLLTIVNGKWSLRNDKYQRPLLKNIGTVTIQTNFAIFIEHMTTLSAKEKQAMK